MANDTIVDGFAPNGELGAERKIEYPIRMSDKEKVIEFVRSLPDDSTMVDIGREVAFLAGLRAAEEQANRGELIDHDRIREELSTWRIK